MNVKRDMVILIIGIILLASAIILRYFMPREVQSIVLFFGGLGGVLIIGVLLMVPFCLLLVKYFTKR